MFCALPGCADKFLLHGTTEPVAEMFGTTPVHIPVADRPFVEAWCARPADAQPDAQPRAFVLHFIGNGDRAELAASAIADLWTGHSVEVWAMNYAGYGGSPGPSLLRSIPTDALASYDALRACAGTRPIFVSGVSMGTTAALHVAASRPVAGLMLQDPPPLRRLILGHYGWWNLWLGAIPVSLRVPNELDSIANAGRVTSPAVFILDGDDHIVPSEYQRLVVDACAGDKRTIQRPGAPHAAYPSGPSRAELRLDIAWLWSRAGLTTELASRSDRIQ